MTDMDGKRKTIARDISWLSFNARVLQEAADPTVPLKERIRFLGIFSNNLDEFFRVRVATLRRMIEITGKKTKANMHLEESPEKILEEIMIMVLRQQNEFNLIWESVRQEMEKEKVFLISEKQLNKEQKAFVKQYFEEEVRVNTIPLMIEQIPQFPYLRDKSIYMGVVMTRRTTAFEQKYAIIEVPSKVLGRFVLLPCPPGEKHIILLEDIIRFNLPALFSYFQYEKFDSWVFKVTKDAEIDIDNDISTTLIQKIEKGVKNRRKGKPVRFVYDKEMDAGLLEFLMRRMNLTKKDNLIPGGRIHNFRHFMDFPDILPRRSQRKKPFIHPLLASTARVTDIIQQKDVMLCFPYHSFGPVIELLREAAMDPDVVSIKITAYRLAENSRIINAIINAVRNGKQVTVMMELRARFEEEANLEWKERLEEEGVKVLIGIPNMKVHAKLCIIRKRVGTRTIQYGFVSTGNLNESTARVYGDHCLLTAHRGIMADINRIFLYLEKYRTQPDILKGCKTLIPCPGNLRRELLKHIAQEIRAAKKKKKAGILLKLNSLSDEALIEKLTEAARAGVNVRLIVRGIFCMYSENKKFRQPVKAISIIDEYLEHARVFVFHNGGKEKVFISSADWMVRNLDHRVEVTCPIFDEDIRKLLRNMLKIQLNDNVKARILNNSLTNEYVRTDGKKLRSQVEQYIYLQSKQPKMVEITEEAAEEAPTITINETSN
ncbi:polyphosphate kinase 1 [Flavihumibacter petaseus]|uniref:Polyphosphate kinase n=1 Tax=Flavihumibacter petaseus NBRC 106054 TaxID=1220578 RepID=A0A0E9N4Z1_9BACT|nr:polyphosphate kinase 1 [Flavihumibacter petaseus]GAO44410.1 polyphosphate kinase [Flavihumibacter petaseus NBRC 106054]